MQLKYPALILISLLSPASPVRAQDSTLGHLVHRVLRSELIGGGSRDTLVWQAADSRTFTILRQAPVLPNHRLDAPPPRTMHCPSSTDGSKGLFAQPVGYTVYANVFSDSLNRRVLEVRVSCTFTYHGQPSRFIEIGKWLVTREGRAWKLGIEIERSIT